jgi:carnitine-CoA ligase
VLDIAGDRTLTDLLEEQVELRGDQTYLVYEDKDGAISELTYAELYERARRCAAGFAACGVGKDDFVVVHLRNSPEVLAIWFALARLGATFVPSNVNNTAVELEHVIGFTEAKLAITEPDLLAPVEQAVATLDGSTEILVSRGDAGGHRSFDEVADADGELPEVEIAATDRCEIIFTSGTTRKPKAVMLSHANCVRAGLDAVLCHWLEPGERCFTALPLFPVNAQAMSALAAMTAGGTLILIEEFARRSSGASYAGTRPRTRPSWRCSCAR